MSDRIKLTPDEIISMSTNFRKVSSEMENLEKQIDSELNRLQSLWQGEASRQFYQRWSADKTSFAKIRQILDKAEEALKDYVQRMTEADNLQVSQVNSVSLKTPSEIPGISTQTSDRTKVIYADSEKEAEEIINNLGPNESVRIITPGEPNKLKEIYGVIRSIIRHGETPEEIEKQKGENDATGIRG